jgi:hypothetical protein
MALTSSKSGHNAACLSSFHGSSESIKHRVECSLLTPISLATVQQYNLNHEAAQLTTRNTTYNENMAKQSSLIAKMLKQLYSTYGENDLYNSGRFNPLTRNLTSGVILNQAHHCERCQGKMSRSCFESLHYAFCATWVTTEDGVRERCGERFCLRSQGCGKHSKVQGFNGPFYRAAQNEDIELSEFDDPELSKPVVPEANPNVEEAQLSLVDEAAEAHIATYGYLPDSFHNDYYAKRADELRLQSKMIREATIAQVREATVAQQQANKNGRTKAKPGKTVATKRK